MKKITIVGGFCIFAAITLAASGCSTLKTPHTVAPGSTVQASSLDSETFNLLLGTKTVIDQTKAALASNVFDAVVGAQIKVALEELVPAYNSLESSYEVYHKAIVAGTATPAQAAAVSSAAPAVQSAVSKLNAVKPVSENIRKSITENAKNTIDSQAGQPINMNLISQESK